MTDDGQKTSRQGIFAGGDLARGGATVILAMRDGKNAAAVCISVWEIMNIFATLTKSAACLTPALWSR